LRSNGHTQESGIGVEGVGNGAAFLIGLAKYDVEVAPYNGNFRVFLWTPKQITISVVVVNVEGELVFTRSEVVAASIGEVALVVDELGDGGLGGAKAPGEEQQQGCDLSDWGFHGFFLFLVPGFLSFGGVWFVGRISAASSGKQGHGMVNGAVLMHPARFALHSHENKLAT